LIKKYLTTFIIYESIPNITCGGGTMKYQFTIALAMLIIVGCATTPIGVKEKPIKIGVLTPLTGDAVIWGIAAKQGIDLAYNDLENKNIELIYEDSMCDPVQGNKAAHKLVHMDKVDAIIGTICSSVTLAISPLAEERQMILISTGASNPKISNAGDFVFRLYPSDLLEGAEIAEFASKNFDTFAILYLNNDYGVGLKQVFTETVEKNGKKVLASESFELNANDFRTQLVKIKDKNPDAIVAFGNPEETPLIAKQIKELGLKNKVIMNGPSVEIEGFLDSAGNSAENIIYAMPIMPTAESFRELHKTVYNEEPGLMAPLGYDTLTILAQSMQGCKDSVCVKNKIYQFQNYNGASGIVSFDENGDVIKPFEIKIVKDGAFIRYSQDN